MGQGTMTERLEHFAEHMVIGGHSPSTVRTQLASVRRFLSWADGEGIEDAEAGYNDLLAYVKHVKERGVTQRTVQLYVNALKHYFRFLQHAAQLTDHNPAEHVNVKGIRRSRLYDLFTGEELEAIHRNYRPAGAIGKRNRAIVGLLVHQGLRTEELQRLVPSDLELREGKVHVPAGRRSAERRLELRSSQIMELQEYDLRIRPMLLEMTGKQSDRLFVSMGSSHRFSNMMVKLMKGLRRQEPRVQSAKQVRASVITDWLRRYGLRRAQYLAGHRHVSSTEMYRIGHLEDLQSDIDRFHPSE